MPPDTANHPCFNDSARHTYGRIHLPVASQCNIQCNFCDRRFDCLNESRPGVCSRLLSPGQALYYLERALAVQPSISVAGIAGPGDPFANPDATIETLRLVREHYPDMLLCVATNGLNVFAHAGDLAALGVSHVTITVNAVDAEIGRKIYAWVRDGKRMLRGREAARVLLARQLKAIRALSRLGVTVKINTIVIPGVNDAHAAEVARVTARCGAAIQNCLSLYPVESTPFGELEPVPASRMLAIRAKAALTLRQMSHCARCRADAAGLLSQAAASHTASLLQEASSQPLQPLESRPYVAVASAEGLLVNRHLGEASQLMIYRQSAEEAELIETRDTPPPGSGDRRWADLAMILSDCRAVVSSGMGENPRIVLGQHGIRALTAEGLVEDAVLAVFRGEVPPAPVRTAGGCGQGISCGGDGLGCA